jgi:hypothetical protein
MKSWLFFIALSSFLGTFCQEIKRAPVLNITLEIVSFNLERNEDDLLKFDLKLSNSSSKSLYIPEEFIAAPEHFNLGNIGYEVLYCTPIDTINYTESIVVYPQGRKTEEKFTILPRDSALVFSTSIEALYFWQGGQYLIRFYLKPSHFPTHLSETITTNWLPLTIIESLRFAGEKTKTPVFRTK